MLIGPDLRSPIAGLPGISHEAEGQIRRRAPVSALGLNTVFSSAARERVTPRHIASILSGHSKGVPDKEQLQAGGRATSLCQRTGYERRAGGRIPPSQIPATKTARKQVGCHRL